MLTDPSGAAVGRVFLQVEQWAVQVGGHLWWRRWSPETSAVHGYIVFIDGRSPEWTDFVTLDGLEEQLRDWAVGDFQLYGVRHRVAWLDDVDSDMLRRDLGLEPEPAP